MATTSRDRLLIVSLAVLGTFSGATAGPWAGGAPGSAAAATLRTYQAATLTPYRSDKVNLTPTSTDLFFQAPVWNSPQSNLRKVIWANDSVNALNEQSCATWVGESDANIQEGAALRIVSTPAGTRALTVTKNVIYSVHWVFNVHAWDSTNISNPGVQIASFDMSKVIRNVLGHTRFMPWTVCLRAVDSTLTFKIWFPDITAEPSWTDPDYTRTATIPAAYTAPGIAGWYVGHVPAGAYGEYTNLTTQTL